MAEGRLVVVWRRWRELGVCFCSAARVAEGALAAALDAEEWNGWRKEKVGNERITNDEKETEETDIEESATTHTTSLRAGLLAVRQDEGGIRFLRPQRHFFCCRTDRRSLGAAGSTGQAEEISARFSFPRFTNSFALLSAFDMEMHSRFRRAGSETAYAYSRVLLSLVPDRHGRKESPSGASGVANATC